MSKAEKIQTKLMAMLEGEPWMLADGLGRYEGAVIVSPDRKMWTRISYRETGMTALNTMRPCDLDRNADWSVVRPAKYFPPDLGSLNICRTEEGLAKLRAYAKRGGEASQYIKAQRAKEAAEEEERSRAFWSALEPQPHALVTGYTIDECRSGIQQSHPDKGGDPHLFELWKARLEHAKSQAASNQP